MRTSTAIAILCVFMAGCQKDPAPAPASTAPPVVKPDAGLKDLLKRADAVTPKDAPDTLPAVPLGGAPPEKVVVVQGNRPGPAPYYGSSATPYSRTLPSTPQRSETETMLDKAERAFGYRVSNLSYQKSSLASIRAQKTNACTGTMAANPVNGDFPASAAKLSQNKSDSPECKMITSQLEREERSFRQLVDSIEVEASRMGIYPGVMRDLYTRHGFNPF